MSERVVIVTGARDWQDADAVWRVLDECQPTCVVQGGCPSDCIQQARGLGMLVRVYEP